MFVLKINRGVKEANKNCYDKNLGDAACEVEMPLQSEMLEAGSNYKIIKLVVAKMRWMCLSAMQKFVKISWKRRSHSGAAIGVVKPMLVDCGTFQLLFVGN